MYARKVSDSEWAVAERERERERSREKEQQEMTSVEYCAGEAARGCYGNATEPPVLSPVKKNPARGG